MKRITIALTLCLLSACESARTGSVEEASTLWKQAGPPKYQLTYKKRCFCEGDGVAMSVVVAANQIESVNGKSAIELSPDARDKTLTVERMFQFIRDGKSSDVVVTAKYDATLGYPTEIHVDSKATDGDATITVTALEPRQ